jgi:hypothetical protein
MSWLCLFCVLGKLNFYLIIYGCKSRSRPFISEDWLRVEQKQAGKLKTNGKQIIIESINYFCGLQKNWMNLHKLDCESLFVFMPLIKKSFQRTKTAQVFAEDKSHKSTRANLAVSPLWQIASWRVFLLPTFKEYVLWSDRCLVWVSWAR